MGTKHSDAKEQNFYDTYGKYHPLYRLVRMGVYAGKGEFQQVKKTTRTDLADYNPIKVWKGVYNGIKFNKKDFKDDVWIGKRTLASGWLSVGVTYSPGFDLMHWAVLINGRFYQVAHIADGGYCKVTVGDWDDRYKEFNWTYLDLKVSKSDQIIEKEAKKYEQYKYFLICKEKTLNCQTFVLHLL